MLSHNAQGLTRNPATKSEALAPSRAHPRSPVLVQYLGVLCDARTRANYSDYRRQRRPTENMNVGRTWRVRERYSFNLRLELTNVFNRGFWGNPSATNAQATQSRLANGNTALSSRTLQKKDS